MIFRRRIQNIHCKALPHPFSSCIVLTVCSGLQKMGQCVSINKLSMRKRHLVVPVAKERQYHVMRWQDMEPISCPMSLSELWRRFGKSRQGQCVKLETAAIRVEVRGLKSHKTSISQWASAVSCVIWWRCFVGDQRSPAAPAAPAAPAPPDFLFSLPVAAD